MMMMVVYFGVQMLQEDLDEVVRAREKLAEQKQHTEEQLQHTHLSHQAAMETLKVQTRVLFSPERNVVTPYSLSSLSVFVISLFLSLFNSCFLSLCLVFLPSFS